MKDRLQKKKYCRPQAEVLGMEDEGCLLHGSWHNVAVSGSRSSYGDMEDLDDTPGGGSRLDFFDDMDEDEIW